MSRLSQAITVGIAGLAGFQLVRSLNLFGGSENAGPSGFYGDAPAGDPGDGTGGSNASESGPSVILGPPNFVSPPGLGGGANAASGSTSPTVGGFPSRTGRGPVMNDEQQNQESQTAGASNGTDTDAEPDTTNVTIVEQPAGFFGDTEGVTDAGDNTIGRVDEGQTDSDPNTGASDADQPSGFYGDTSGASTSGSSSSDDDDDDSGTSFGRVDEGETDSDPNTGASDDDSGGTSAPSGFFGDVGGA